MNKLLISLLSLTGVAGISTGSYFLLKNNSEKNKKIVEASDTNKSKSDKDSGASESPETGKSSDSGTTDASPQAVEKTDGKDNTQEAKAAE